jgi:hypothetical protein
VDYSEAEQAECYDERHGKFRNYEREFKKMMDFLSLHNTKHKTIVDLGCGYRCHFHFGGWILQDRLRR